MKKSNLQHSYYAVNSIDGRATKKLKTVVNRFDLIKSWLSGPMFSPHEKNTTKQSKYKIGQVVYAKVEPYLALVVTSYLSKIYYCQVKDKPGKKELVYFERELLGTMVPLAKIKVA